MTEALRLTTSEGLALEGALDEPTGPAKAVVVVCHPHPKMGGTMNAPLLLALRDGMVKRAWASLRFNFRGVGASEGTSSSGIDEVADAEAALALAHERLPGLPVAIAGWSFGAAVALRVACAHPELTACVAIAPAIVPRPGITAGAPSPEDFTFRGPTLLVCAANDDLVAPSDCRGWATETRATIEEMDGANHFFWAKYEPLADIVGDFLDRAVTS